MRRVELNDCSGEVRKLCEGVQHDHVLLTENGEPVGMIVSLMCKDEEDLQMEASPAFWHMIAQRRKSNEVVTLEELKGEAGIPAKTAKRKPRSRPA